MDILLETIFYDVIQPSKMVEMSIFRGSILHAVCSIKNKIK